MFREGKHSMQLQEPLRAPGDKDYGSAQELHIPVSVTEAEIIDKIERLKRIQRNLISKAKPSFFHKLYKPSRKKKELAIDLALCLFAAGTIMLLYSSSVKSQDLGDLNGQIDEDWNQIIVYNNQTCAELLGAFPSFANACTAYHPDSKSDEALSAGCESMLSKACDISGKQIFQGCLILLSFLGIIGTSKGVDSRISLETPDCLEDRLSRTDLDFLRDEGFYIGPDATLDSLSTEILGAIVALRNMGSFSFKASDAPDLIRSFLVPQRGSATADESREQVDENKAALHFLAGLSCE